MKLKINHIFLIQLLFLSLAGITAFQKISGLEIPEWFIHKFENSFINLIPFGITFSFIVITLLETIITIDEISITFIVIMFFLYKNTVFWVKSAVFYHIGT